MKTAAFRLALAVALFSVATHAFSQDGGLYLSAGTMATFAGPQDFEVGAKPAEDADFTATRKGTGTFDVGILGFRAAVGYRIFGFRPEAEVSYRQLKLSGFEYTSYGELPGAGLDALNESIKVEAGDLKLLGVMANVWYDIDIGSGFMPYLGGGVGLGHITPGQPLPRQTPWEGYSSGSSRIERLGVRLPGRRWRGLRDRRGGDDQPRLSSVRHHRGRAALECRGH